MNIQRYTAAVIADFVESGNPDHLVPNQAVGRFVEYEDHQQALSALEEQLTAMTKDRNLWQDAHNEDCPNKIAVDALEEHLRETKDERNRIDGARMLQAAKTLELSIALETARARIAELEKTLDKECDAHQFCLDKDHATQRQVSLTAAKSRITELTTLLEGYYQGICCCDDRHACDFCKQVGAVLSATEPAPDPYTNTEGYIGPQ
jgi:hypothetical protein